MSKIEIGNIRLKNNDTSEAKSKVADAEKRKKDANETLEEAWARIKQSKSYEKDKEKLDEVYEAMMDGRIGREQAPEGKKQPKFSAAEALRLWRVLEDEKKEERIQSLIDSTPSNYYLVNDETSLHSLREAIESSNLIAIDCETYGESPGDQFDPWVGGMVGFSVTTAERHFYVPLNHTEGKQLSEDIVWEVLKEPMEQTPNVMHNAPFDAKFFLVHYNVDLVQNLFSDTQILGMAADENIPHSLKDMAERFLGLKESWSYDKLFTQAHRFNEVPLDAALVYAAGDTDKTLSLYYFMKEQFHKTEEGKRIFNLVQKTEIPVAQTFIYADLRGLNFNVELAKELDEKFEKEESQLEAEIHELLGEEINLGSPAQLARKLYDDLKLPKKKKRSTATKVITKIKNKHPVIPKILEYRQVNQLRKAFTKKLPGSIKRDGKIHQEHNTWGTKTSRFTCRSPNTQQLPSKRPEIRHVFYPNDGRIFFAIDYSQIELRVLAHLANEEVLIQAFREGRDIHSTTAAQISGIPYEQIEERKDVEGSKEQKARKQAKPVNFGIAYGLTPFGLSEQLDISEKEARSIINAFFDNYPGIRDYMQKQKRTARQRGYVTEMFGRKRRLQDQYNRGFYSSADRQAGNYPIQSSAGAILKLAIVDLQPVLEKHNVQIALQIHDELLFEADEDISREAMEKIQQTMENAVQLSVPVKCDVEISPNYWMENLSMDEWFEKVS